MELEQLESSDIGYVASRLPARVRALLQEHSYSVLAGGFVRDCIAKQEPTDADIFVPSANQAIELARLLGTPDVHTTDFAHTVKVDGLLVQFVHRWTFSEPIAVLEHFDFTIAAAAIFWKSDHWAGLCHKRFYRDLAARRLTYTYPKDAEPGGSLLRTLKFHRRGFTIPLDDLSGIVSRVYGKTLSGGIVGRDTQSLIEAALREVDPIVM